MWVDLYREIVVSKQRKISLIYESKSSFLIFKFQKRSFGFCDIVKKKYLFISFPFKFSFQVPGRILTGFKQTVQYTYRLYEANRYSTPYSNDPLLVNFFVINRHMEKVKLSELVVF